MAAWLNAVVGMAVDQGFADWQPIFAWGVDLHIQQSNGTSGWNRQWPVPYYCVPNKDPASYKSLDPLFQRHRRPMRRCDKLGRLLDLLRRRLGRATDVGGHTIDTAGWDGHTIMQQFYQTGPSFFLHLRAVLAVAVTRGIAGAQACYDYIQSELTNSVMPHYRKPGQARFSIDPNPGGRGGGSHRARSW